MLIKLLAYNIMKSNKFEFRYDLCQYCHKTYLLEYQHRCWKMKVADFFKICC